MKKVIVPFLILLFTTALWAQPLPVKSTHTVIIDTDGAIDDMRAINLLLTQPEITIKAILTTDGSLPPNESAENIRSLLHEFNYDSIPVAIGDMLKGVNPPWRQFNRQIWWGKETSDRGTYLNALDCLTEKLNAANEKIILVCLGPMTNIANLIKKDPILLKKIERIIWYNQSVQPLQGFNYDCDKDNANLVFQSNIRVDVISNLEKEEALFDTSLYVISRNLCQQLSSQFTD